MSVHGTEWVVQNDDVAVTVRSSRQIDSLLLSAAQIDSFLADLRQISRSKQLQIRNQTATMQDAVVS